MSFDKQTVLLMSGAITYWGLSPTAGGVLGFTHGASVAFVGAAAVAFAGLGMLCALAVWEHGLTPGLLSLAWLGSALPIGVLLLGLGVTWGVSYGVVATIAVLPLTEFATLSSNFPRWRTTLLGLVMAWGDRFAICFFSYGGSVCLALVLAGEWRRGVQWGSLPLCLAALALAGWYYYERAPRHTIRVRRLQMMVLAFLPALPLGVFLWLGLQQTAAATVVLLLGVVAVMAGGIADWARNVDMSAYRREYRPIRVTPSI